MQDKHVLIVEDEAPVREMMGFWLRRYGLAVAEAANAESARLSVAQRRPDLILLDWVLPGASGLDLARALRHSRLTDSIPIIMVTGRIEESDKVVALDCGIDDYVSKPFAPRELLARIAAVLRRAPRLLAASTVASRGIVLDADQQSVMAHGERVQLAPMDFRLLEFFLSNPERVHSRAQLLACVWGSRGPTEERTVDVQIRRLRQALQELQLDPLVQTVRGAGYRFSTRR